MKALSVRQPWAWLIVHGYKDVENRDWQYLPRERGRIYIHASKGCTRDEYEEAAVFAYSVNPDIKIPPLSALWRGGIVGTAELVDAVRDYDSRWFFGPVGLVLRNAKPKKFVPCKGMLGFFTPSIG